MAIQNILKLHETLVSNGLNIVGINSNGVISWEGTPTKADITLANSLIKNFADYDPALDLVSQQDKIDSLQNRLDSLMDTLVLKSVITKTDSDTIKLSVVEES